MSSFLTFVVFSLERDYHLMLCTATTPNVPILPVWYCLRVSHFFKGQTIIIVTKTLFDISISPIIMNFRNIKKWYKLNVDTPRSFFWLQLCNADLIYHHGHENCTDSYSYSRRHELIFPLFWSFTQQYNVFKPLRLQSSRTLYKLHRNQRTYNGYY